MVRNIRSMVAFICPEVQGLGVVARRQRAACPCACFSRPRRHGGEPRKRPGMESAPGGQFLLQEAQTRYNLHLMVRYTMVHHSMVRHSMLRH